MQANLVLWSPRSRWGDLLVLQGQEKVEKSTGVWAVLKPCTWVSLRPESKPRVLTCNRTHPRHVHLTCTLHTTMMSTAPVFLFPSAQKVFPNSWPCLMLSPWLLALCKRMQGMDYLLCCSMLYPPAPLFQTKWTPPIFPLGLWQGLGPNDSQGCLIVLKMCICFCSPRYLQLLPHFTGATETYFQSQISTRRRKTQDL